MKTQTDIDCQRLSHELRDWRNDINKLRDEIHEFENSIRGREAEIDRLKIENQQLQSMAAAAAARAAITRNSIKISRLEAETASVRQEIEEGERKIRSWEESVVQAERQIQKLECRF